jgi:hypothetical protein
MADGVMVPCAVRTDDEYGQFTHIERINGWENPAAIPGIFYGSPVNRPGEDETFTEQQS